MKNLSLSIKVKSPVMRKKSGVTGFKRQLLFLVVLFSGFYASAQPIVTSLSASSGIPGASMTISGSGFNTTTTNNAVYFGATKAAVTSASATALTVTIPVGATYMPVSVTNTGTGLTGYSKSAFLPSYDGSQYISGNFNFEPKYDLENIHIQTDDYVIADIDGDGKSEIIVADNYNWPFGGAYIAVYRNTSTTGTLGAGSFASEVTYSVPGMIDNVVVADMNGDGKQDLVVSSSTVGFCVFRNTATSGTINSSTFATRVDISSGASHELAVGDINGDGKPDVIQANNTSMVVSAFQNTSSGSSISFAAGVNFATNDAPISVKVADMDGDGKTDVIAVDYFSGYGFSVFRNTGAGGSITSGSLASRVEYDHSFGITKLYTYDMDGDGKLDIVVSAVYPSNHKVSIYRNVGSSGTFTTGSLASRVDFTVGRHVGIGDFDGDSKPDIVGMVDLGASEPLNFYNISSGLGLGFYRNTATSGTINSSSFAAAVKLYDLDGAGYGSEDIVNIAVGDMDGDGQPDMGIVTGDAGSGSTDRMAIIRNNALKSPPTISALGAVSGIPGASVTISGTNFNSTPSNNIVHFGTSKATVTSATTTSLTVTVPLGATYVPVSVNNTATSLTGYSLKSFLPTFDGSSYVSGTVNFDPKVTFDNSNPNGAMAVLADIDGDGKLDMIAHNSGSSNTISVYQNTSTSGSVTSGSFASAVNFATASGPKEIKVIDIDGDGKKDVLVTTYTGYFSVLRNTATPGTINSGSLAAKVDVSGAGNFGDVGDVDGDGKPDVVSLFPDATPEDAFYMNRNRSTVGTISFAAATGIKMSGYASSLFGDAFQGLKLVDIDGDGKRDMVILRGYQRSIHVCHNSSRMGAVAGNIPSATGGALGTLISFEPPVLFENSSSGFSYFHDVEVGDIDGDGKQDLVLCYDAGICVRRNTATSGAISSGSFGSEVLFTSTGTMGQIELGDMNGDGKPDIVSTKGDSTVAVYLNTATSGTITTGSFAAPANFTTNYLPDALSLGDVDGDGKSDIVAGCTAYPTSVSKISVLRNSPSSISGLLSMYIAGTTTLTATPTGGTWSSSSPSIATVGSSSGVVTGVATGTATITYFFPSSGFVTAVVSVCPAPAAITGTMTVCTSATTTLSNATSGGTWSSSNTSKATVGSTGIVTGVTPGTCTITYYTGCGTGATATITVNSTPNVFGISGATSLCVGATVTLTNSVSGGTWSSSNTARATVGSTTGIVSGVGAGTVNITYTVTNTCGSSIATKQMTVNGPAAITGALGICVSGSTTLSSATTVGTWASSNTSIATVGFGTGFVSGVTAGTATITYTKSGCFTTAVVSVSSSVSAGTITGSSSVTTSATTSLSDAASGGVWSSSNTSIATVGTTGIVTGVTTGTAIISYSVTNGCGTAVATINITVTPSADPCLSWTVTGASGLSSDWAHYTSIAIDPSGVPYLAFRDLDGAYFNTVKRFVGGSWEIVGPAGLSGRGDNLSIVIDASGTPYIAYKDVHDDTGMLQTVVRKFNGTDWEMLGGTEVSGGATDYTAIALDPSGTPYVVYQDADNGQKATVKKYDGTNWVTVGSAGFSAGIAGYTSIAIDGSGTPYVVYRDEGNGTKATVMKFDGSSWVALGSVGFSTGEVEFTTIRINAGGTPYVSYQDAAAGYKATVKKFNGSSWVTVGTQGFTPDATNYNSLAIDGDGTPYVAYMDYSNGQKATVKKFDGVNWVTAGNEGLSLGAAYYTNIAISTSGMPYIAYVDISDHKPTVHQLNSLPNITGTTSICVGATTTLSNLTPGGTWSSSNASVATVGSATGVVTGVASGTSTISYVLGSGCSASLVVSVIAAPGAITGPATLCKTLTFTSPTTTYTNATAGGLWSSSNPTVGSIGSASGAFRPLSAGEVIITYTIGALCVSTKSVTVNTIAVTVQFPQFPICVGATGTLTNATPGGVWSTGSSNVTVGSTTGVVTGLATGSAFIQYLVTSTGCFWVSDVNVTPAVASISGASGICIGSTSTLSSTTSGGTWSSSNTSVATVGSGTGIVTGVATGTSTISYVVSAGCFASLVVTVNASSGVGAITGSPILCAASTTTLANATSGGSWSSSNTSIATVGSSSGVVSGVAPGEATITYMLAAGCYATQGVTVNAAPAAITGVASLCEGNTTTLANTTSGGTWVSSNTSVATIGSSIGIVTGVLSGTSTIAYTTGTGCVVTRDVTVTTTPSSVSGTLLICSGSTPLTATPSGGTWTSSNTSVATVGTSGVVTVGASGTATITYSLGSGCNSMATVTVGLTPAAINGAPAMCIGGTAALSSLTSGCVWSSANTSVATVSGAGLVTGISVGNAIISYTHSSGCARTIIATVNAAPGANTGTPIVCVGSTTTLGNATTGGTWSSGTPAKASVNATTGVVTGVSGGTVNISYTLGAGCVSITQVTVNTALASISGTTNVCVGVTTTFTHAVTGGVWTSSNAGLATVGSATGLITGIAAGTPTITYTVGGCFKTKPITINGGTLAITGNTGVCQSATSVLACSTPGGLSWSSSNPAVATIGSTSGVVTGVTLGTADITYTAISGCTSTTVVTVLPLPTAISGTLTFCKAATTTLASVGTTGGTWVSSILSKATVGSVSGIVTGVNAGTSNITYTWTNGCKRTAQVTVNPLPVAGAIVGAGTMSVSATQILTPSSPGGTWTSANPGKATIVAGTGFMTGVSVGTVVISYTNTNSCGAATVTRIFSITASRQGVFAGADENVKFSVYPNPTSGQLTIEAPVTGVFTVYTIDGRLVQQYTIADTMTKLTLPNSMASGVYMCRFNGEDGTTVMTRLVVE